VNGLNDLIQTLQLKERGSVLINLLLQNGTRSRVTFKEFREGLLQVITSEQDGNGAAADDKFFFLFFVFWHFHGGGHVQYL
jgi:hypothetical protein